MAQGCELIYSDADRDRFPLPEKQGDLRMDPDDHEQVREEMSHVADRFRMITYGIEAYPGSDPIQDVVRTDGKSCWWGKETLQWKVREPVQQEFERRFALLDYRDREFVLGLLAARQDRQADIVKYFGNPSVHNTVTGHDMVTALKNVLSVDPSNGMKAFHGFDKLRQSGNKNDVTARFQDFVNASWKVYENRNFDALDPLRNSLSDRHD